MCREFTVELRARGGDPALKGFLSASRGTRGRDGTSGSAERRRRSRKRTQRQKMSGISEESSSVDWHDEPTGSL
jgi:hypothetical protein